MWGVSGILITSREAWWLLGKVHNSSDQLKDSILWDLIKQVARSWVRGSCMGGPLPFMKWDLRGLIVYNTPSACSLLPLQQLSREKRNGLFLEVFLIMKQRWKHDLDYFCSHNKMLFIFKVCLQSVHWFRHEEGPMLFYWLKLFSIFFLSSICLYRAWSILHSQFISPLFHKEAVLK